MTDIQQQSAETVSDDRPDVARLWQNLQERLPDLQELLDTVNGHWGGEDAVYRFYHQSFKVYHLQGLTEDIVARLCSLLPDRPLNDWFNGIIEQGTGKTFKLGLRPVCQTALVIPSPMITESGVWGQTLSTKVGDSGRMARCTFFGREGNPALRDAESTAIARPGQISGLRDEPHQLPWICKKEPPLLPLGRSGGCSCYDLSELM